MVSLKINGKKIQVAPNTTVLEAAQQLGVVIPTLCHHKDLTPYGGCRMCIVEIKGERNLQASCIFPVQDGMNIKTESKRLSRYRKNLLEMILSSYHDAGYASGTRDGQDNELYYWAERYGVDPHEVMGKEPWLPVGNDPNPFVWVDMNKCILCTRCIRACSEVQGRFVWSMAERGYDARVVAGADTTMLEARCESCGACVAYCPTGALDNKMSMSAGLPEKSVTTTCTYCGVGCSFDLQVRANKIIRVVSNPDAPVNGMHLCVKGRYGYDFVHHADRLKTPLVREYLLKGEKRADKKDRGSWVEVDWDTALRIASEHLVNIRNSFGPDSIGLLSSAKCTNEENYLVNKLARQLIGTNNIDHCARLCHSSTVAGLAASFGSGAMSNTMRDVAEQAAAILIIGSNTTEQHPVFGTMIRQAIERRGARLVVADPRKIDITEFADLHIRQNSGTDVALINGIMHIILANGWEDKEFIKNRTEGFEELRDTLTKYTPDRTAEITGVPVEQLHQAAELIGTNKPMAVIWAMGITQHTTGVANVMTLANLQMLLGNMGVPGGGVNPLRGQNNVQGACDMGGLPNVYPGYQAVTNAESRLKFENAWGIPLSPHAGLTVTEMIPAAGEGKIKAMYILGENPVLTDADSNHVRHCLEECEFIVLQEIFPSETSAYADVLLPGVTFAEKEGTYTNTERRVQLIRQAIYPEGKARPDWLIIADLAKYIINIGDRKPVETALLAGWAYRSSAEVMSEIAQVTPSYAGINHIRLENGDQLHWPVPGADHPGTPILHTIKFTRGLGLFSAIDHIPPAELPDDEYPMILNTGRVLYHWHGGEMTRRAQGLLEVYDEALIEVNPEDAERIGLNGHQYIQVTSRRGSIRARAWTTDRVPKGMVYANFHFPESPANELTIAALDPISKIPEYKVCAVRVEPTT
jgi:formate dehydrogenase alpha subunit